MPGWFNVRLSSHPSQDYNSMSTFWKPVFVKEPAAEQRLSTARRCTDDLVGHSNPTMRWEGSGPGDDDEWRGRRPKRELAAPHDEKLYIFKLDDATVAPNSKPFGGPKLFDARDRTAAARRQEMEAVPLPPPLTERIKNSAGLWSWQQREVRLENRIIRKYAGGTSRVDAKVCAAAPLPTVARPNTADHHGGAGCNLAPTASSPRREAVKRKIMAMAERFGV